MTSKTPRAKTFEEVFPATLPASDTPPILDTIVDHHIAPFYSLGWRFAEFDLHRHFDEQPEWDENLNAMSDSQSKWVNPRWMCYAKELPPDHRPMIHFMSNGDALYQVAINFPSHLKTLEESESKQRIIAAAVDILRLSEDQASELKWHRIDPWV